MVYYSCLSILKLVGRVKGRNPTEAIRASDVDLDMIPHIIRIVGFRPSTRPTFLEWTIH